MASSASSEMSSPRTIHERGSSSSESLSSEPSAMTSASSNDTDMTTNEDEGEDFEDLQSLYEQYTALGSKLNKAMLTDSYRKGRLAALQEVNAYHLNRTDSIEAHEIKKLRLHLSSEIDSIERRLGRVEANQADLHRASNTSTASTNDAPKQKLLDERSLQEWADRLQRIQKEVDGKIRRHKEEESLQRPTSRSNESRLHDKDSQTSTLTTTPNKSIFRNVPVGFASDPLKVIKENHVSKTIGLIGAKASIALGQSQVVKRRRTVGDLGMEGMKGIVTENTRVDVSLQCEGYPSRPSVATRQVKSVEVGQGLAIGKVREEKQYKPVSAQCNAMMQVEQGINTDSKLYTNTASQTDTNTPNNQLNALRGLEEVITSFTALGVKSPEHPPEALAKYQSTISTLMRATEPRITLSDQVLILQKLVSASIGINLVCYQEIDRQARENKRIYDAIVEALQNKQQVSITPVSVSEPDVEDDMAVEAVLSDAIAEEEYIGDDDDHMSVTTLSDDSELEKEVDEDDYTDLVASALSQSDLQLLRPDVKINDDIVDFVAAQYIQKYRNIFHLGSRKRSFTYISTRLWKLIKIRVFNGVRVEGEEQEANWKIVLDSAPRLFERDDILLLPRLDGHYYFVVVRNVALALRHVQLESKLIKESKRVNSRNAAELKQSLQDSCYILIFDSLNHKADTVVRQARLKEMIENFLLYAASIYRGDQIGEDKTKLDIKWHSVVVPSQQKKFDCGPSALRYARLYLSNIDHCIEEIIPRGAKDDPFFMPESMAQARPEIKSLIDTILWDSAVDKEGQLEGSSAQGALAVRDREASCLHRMSIGYNGCKADAIARKQLVKWSIRSSKSKEAMIKVKNRRHPWKPRDKMTRSALVGVISAISKRSGRKIKKPRKPYESP